jgi:hypothetical protein
MFFYLSGFMDVKLRIEKMLEQNCRERWDYTVHYVHKIQTVHYGTRIRKEDEAFLLLLELAPSPPTCLLSSTGLNRPRKEKKV